jgi:hypothetical protein
MPFWNDTRYEIPPSDQVCAATEGPPLRQVRSQAQQSSETVQALYGRGGEAAEIALGRWCEAPRSKLQEPNKFKGAIRSGSDWYAIASGLGEALA